MAEMLEKKKSISISPQLINPDLLSEFVKSITIESDGKISYSAEPEIIDYFLNAGEQHWNASSSFPEDWSFDGFTMQEYKATWKSLFVMAAIHQLACLKSGAEGGAVDNVVIVQKREELISALSELSHVAVDSVKNIVQLLTYDPKIKNTDIMYQPLVQIGSNVLIAPTLIIESNPQRNLMSLLLKTKDSKLSVEVNRLESLMQRDIDEALSRNEHIRIARDIKLPGNLPDIDFAIYDENSNAIMICELKWLEETDSVQETFSRETDIQYGCDQVNKIMSYAVCNKKDFERRTFSLDTENVDYFYCVVAKNNIRYRVGYIPVISLNTLLELLRSHSVNAVFHIIRNREFYKKLPDDFEVTQAVIPYAGYVFSIPAVGIKN